MSEVIIYWSYNMSRTLKEHRNQPEITLKYVGHHNSRKQRTYERMCIVSAHLVRRALLVTRVEGSLGNPRLSSLDPGLD